MRSSNIPSNSAKQLVEQRDLDPGRNAEVKLGDVIASDSKTQILHKPHVMINAQKKEIDGSNKASFSRSSPPPEVQNDSIFDMARINDELNKINKSSLGKTSGVFLVMNPTAGVILAALKPVKDPEILANKLFALLDMPIPAFGVVEKNSFSKAIIDTLDKSPFASTSASKKMMVMEPVSGRAMSEYCAKDLKSFLLNKRNIELLGKSMVLDIFTGNADRIVPFMANTINPDNIMFQDGSIMFIDQALRVRSGQKQSVFSKLADAVNLEPGIPDNKDNVYNKYILPLVDKALGKYKPNAMHNESDLLEKNSYFTEFESSIDLDEKSKINEILISGICGAVHLLIYNKDKVLDLCSSDLSRKNDLAETYVGLEKLSTRFKKN